MKKFNSNNFMTFSKLFPNSYLENIFKEPNKI